MAALTTTLAVIGAGVGLATGLSEREKRRKREKAEGAPALPELPDPQAEQMDARGRATDARERQRRAAKGSGRSRTILTSGSGIADEPAVKRRTLLGM